MTRLYRTTLFSRAAPVALLTGLSGLMAGAALTWCLAGAADAGVVGAPIQVPADIYGALDVASMAHATPGVCL